MLTWTLPKVAQTGVPRFGPLACVSSAAMRLDSVQIGVADLATGTAAYALLIGSQPVERPDGSRRFQLARGAIELVQSGSDGIRSVRFAADEGEEPPDLRGPVDGLTILVDRQAPELPAVEGPVTAIDHVVVRSTHPDRAVALWRDRLGLRLALDRVFADRGLRLLFFRSGGITLEYATPHPPADAHENDRLWGVSYRVRDLAGHRERLLAAGVDVSDVRVGMRPGTSVASVRSGTAGVPTLLLQLV
jgi:catechol 2,3-dioxygenase-like lactoylglutathione lyase family enzyme